MGVPQITMSEKTFYMDVVMLTSYGLKKWAKLKRVCGRSSISWTWHGFCLEISINFLPCLIVGEGASWMNGHWQPVACFIECVVAIGSQWRRADEVTLSCLISTAPLSMEVADSIYHSIMCGMKRETYSITMAYVKITWLSHMPRGKESTEK